MTSTGTPQPALRRRSDRAAGRRETSEQKTEETVRQAFPLGVRHTAPQPAQPNPTPIYAALARQWAAEHRTLPGDFDQEWAALVDYASWRRRQPSGGSLQR